VAQLRSDLNANKTVYEVGASTRSLTSHLDTVFFLRHTCVCVRVGDCAVGGLHHGGGPDCEHSGLRGGLQPQGRHAGEAGQQHRHRHTALISAGSLILLRWFTLMVPEVLLEWLKLFPLCWVVL
jgi:hypothetical protein